MTLAQDDGTLRHKGARGYWQGKLIGLRLSPFFLDRLDAWIADQQEEITRQEAIRRLIDTALSHSTRS